MAKRKPGLKHPLRKQPGAGEGVLTGIGFVLSGLMVSSLAIDLGGYYAVQNQLQTAVDSAALAGAIDLPVSQASAEETAAEYAADNLVNGTYLTADDLSFESDGLTFKVTGATTYVPTVAKLFCKGSVDGYVNPGEGGGGGVAACGIDVKAAAAAKPAARDTVLVIDKSSSMRDLGNMRPLRDVQSAAKKYIDMVADFNNEQVDRIGLVSFHQTGKLDIGLTSQNQSAGFQSVKSKVDSIILFGCGNTSCSTSSSSDSGWNTNYHAGLKLAIDELESNGRPNANRIIIFMTDGRPNLPAPPNYYTSGSDKAPYNRCIDPVDDATEVKETFCDYTTRNGERVYSNCRLRTAPYSHSTSAANRKANTWYVANLSGSQEGVCTMEAKYDKAGSTGKVNGKRFSNCKALPHAIIPDNLIAKYQSTQRANCAVNYTDYMQAQIDAQTERANQLGITIHTIEIMDTESDKSNSFAVFRRLLYDPEWVPGSLDYMATLTHGQAYTSPNYDAAAIEENYEKVAQDIHVILTSH